MSIWGDLLIVLVILIFLGIWIYTLRKRLLKLWTEVTQYEVKFHRQLEKVMRLFYSELELLGNEDNLQSVRMLRRYRKKRVRSLLLSTRQELYKSIVLLFDDLELTEEAQVTVIKEEYEKLQKIRRIYNSRVLMYNQTISVYPTRYLALRMNLELKEYFG
jgi:hypothetical protein